MCTAYDLLVLGVWQQDTHITHLRQWHAARLWYFVLYLRHPSVFIRAGAAQRLKEIAKQSGGMIHAGHH